MLRHPPFSYCFLRVRYATMAVERGDGMILYENKGNTFYAEWRRQFSTDPHLHHHLEILYISQGELDATINDEEYHVTAGDVVFVFPNQIHSFRDLTPIYGHIIIASPDDFPEFAALFKGNLPRNPVFHPQNGDVHELFCRITYHMRRQSEPHYREILRGYSLALLGLLLPQLELRAQRTLNLSMAQQVLLYCDEHYTEPLSLELLSRHFGVSRFYISHLFSEKIKINFNSYIHLLRIQAAKQLLRHENRSITEIADLVGYNNIRSFNRRFCAVAGCTPTDYRRNHADREDAG